MNARDLLEALALVIAGWIGSGLLLLYLVYGNSSERRWPRWILCRLNGYTYRGCDGVVFQDRALNCGAACVEMALVAEGVEYDPGQLRDLRVMDGTSMLDLKAWLARFAVQAEGRRLGSTAALEEAVAGGATALVTLDATYLAPARNLLFAPINLFLMPIMRRARRVAPHWVVVHGSAMPNGLVLRDPFVGEIQVSHDVVARYWDGTALLVA
jgi:hypothetical protein